MATKGTKCASARTGEVEGNMNFEYEKLTQKEKRQYDRLSESGKTQYEKQWIQLQQQKNRMQEMIARDTQKSKKERTHRLCQEGGALEAALGHPIPAEKLEIFMNWIRKNKELIETEIEC